MPDTLAYTGMPLNRNSAARENPDWVGAQLASPARLLTVVRNDENLVVGPAIEARFDNLVVAGEKAASVVATNAELYYLGHMATNPVFVADLSNLDESRSDEILDELGDQCRFHDLRKFGPQLLGPDAAIHAYARGLCYWHRQNRFCSRCGQPQTVCHGGHMKKCSDESCGRLAFPHINPAVIMTVELRKPADGIPKCLLGRHSGLPAGVYSTLAGFVDIGESLEEAVAREVKEEAGVEVSQVRYAGSQPWPFPSSLMMGFRAESEQLQLNVDYDEMEDARWFNVDELKSFGEYGGPENMALPRKDSIARTLIESWIAEQSAIDH